MPLQDFHPLAAAWFEANLGPPTEAQIGAWPTIQAGRHSLIAAPTGSGKTLAAFFVEIDALLRQGLEGRLPDAPLVLYVSPLKALGNDIQRNLELPLAGLRALAEARGEALPVIRTAVRTGDTPQSERQKMVKKPPHILVTTPESLYLLLTSQSGRAMLATVRTVIVDEIHALVGDKRGSHLALSLERLEALAPRRLQRIGLSATQKPIETVARFLVGRAHVNAEGEADCAIIDGGHRKRLDLRLEVPRSPLSALMSNEVWEELYERLVELVDEHRTTLIFVNTRRLAERLALRLGERLGEERVSSHHGSMSKEHRHRAEQRLKSGELRVLVATASMELGIDIGSVNLVVQFASPKRIAAFLQRVGRSGHQVGGLPKGILFPLTRDDLVECAALFDAIRRGELDAIHMPEKPLDILAQQLVAEVGSRDEGEDGVALDELYALVTRAWVYRDLTRAEFDEVLEVAAEGYSGRRGRSGAWLHYDQINQRVRPRPGARLTALTNGGAIPDMFDYQVVLDPDDIVVGSLNEDFALESIPGDIFSLGNHSWRLLRIDGLKVRVADAGGQPPTLPFWLGEGPGRSRELSAAVSRLRLEVRERLDDSLASAVDWLAGELGLQRAAAQQLAEYLKSGSDALGVMPSQQCIVAERFFDEVGDMHLVLHAPFGSRLNKAWGLALRKRFCKQFNFELQAAANEDSIVISLGVVHSFPLGEVFHYLKSASAREVLVQALLDAPLFEVRWRWNATRALAIQRNRAGKRVPPQFQRMQAEDLVAQVFPDQLACFENIQGARQVPEHPLVRQTLDDCLSEAMDLEGLLDLLRAIERGELGLVAKDLREPSPFAQEIINARPYAFLDDAPFEERRTNALRHRGWIDPAESGDMAALDPAAIERVREEAWPWIRSAEELHDALLTLGFMTAREVEGGADQPDCSAWLEPLLATGRAARLSEGATRLWVAAERLPQFRALERGYREEPALTLPPRLLARQWSRDEALLEILRGRLEGLGPVTAAQLAAPLGLPPAAAERALLALEAEGFALRGRFSQRAELPAPADEEWCERRLLQRIHRYSIDAHRESIKPVSLQGYMQFLFELHGLEVLDPPDAERPTPDANSLLAVVERLEGITAPAAAWEAELLPARLPLYDPAWLDYLSLSGRLVWGRLLARRAARQSADRPAESVASRRPGPIKASPLNLLLRERLPLWQTLAAQGEEEAEALLSGPAAQVRDLLAQRGAVFFDDIVRQAGLLRSQVEGALAELVSLGLVTSDSYTGLRALLTPESLKAMAGRRHRGRPVYGMEGAGRWSLLEPPAADSSLNEGELGELIGIYLRRWGVLSRKVLERESSPPPWRQLLPLLRRMELRGELRGGRFVAGIGGEQFALSDTVHALRRSHQALQKRKEAGESGPRVVLSACDPLNLLGVVLPGRRVPNIHSNRVLYEDGLPLAVLEKDAVSFLREVGAEQRWGVEQLLQKRSYPPRLRAYLGKQLH